MRVIVCGSRDWTNEKSIYYALFGLPKGSIVIHGDCRGADMLAGKVASGLGYEVKAFPANWKKFGNGAGPIRNREMLKENPDLVIAFHSDIKSSKGTKDMCHAAKECGVPVILITA